MNTTDEKQNLIDFVNLSQEISMTQTFFSQKIYYEGNLKRKIKKFFEINYKNFDNFGNSLEPSFMLKYKFFRCQSTYYANWYSLTKRPRHGRKVLNEDEKKGLTIEVAIAICTISKEKFSKTEYINEIVSKVENSIGFQLESKKAQCALMLEVLFRYIEQYNLKGWHTENNTITNLTNKFLIMLNN